MQYNYIVHILYYSYHQESTMKQKLTLSPPQALLTSQILGQLQEDIIQEGDDPFNLLQVKPKLSELPSLASICNDMSYSKVEGYEFSYKTSVIHFIWDGSYLSNYHRKNVEKHRELNPNHPIILWIDREFSDSENMKDLIAWAETQKVFLINIDETIVGHMAEFDVLHALARIIPDYGFASDISRILICDLFKTQVNQWYFDVDLKLLMNFKYAERKNVPLFNLGYREVKFATDQAHTRVTTRKVDGFNNNVFYVTKSTLSASYLECYKSLILANYHKPYSELFAQSRDLHDIHKNSISYKFEHAKSLPYQTWRRNITVNMTGPDVSDQLFEKLKEKHPDFSTYQHEIPIDLIEEYGEANWLKPSALQHRTVDVSTIKKNITSCLYQLSREPRILMLNRGTKYQDSHYIVLKFLVKNYPEKLKQVEFVSLPELETVIDDLDIITNKEIFPKLDLSLNAYAEYLCLNPNIYLLKYLFESSDKPAKQILEESHFSISELIGLHSPAISIPTIEYLIKVGYLQKNTSFFLDDDRFTPMTFACNAYKYDLIDCFLDNKFYDNIDAAFMQLSCRGNIEDPDRHTSLMRKMLNEHKANINYTNPSGLTALHVACYRNQPVTAIFLIENGADINMPDESRKTPLVYLLHDLIFEYDTMNESEKLNAQKILRAYLNTGKVDLEHSPKSAFYDTVREMLDEVRELDPILADIINANIGVTSTKAN